MIEIAGQVFQLGKDNWIVILVTVICFAAGVTFLNKYPSEKLEGIGFNVARFIENLIRNFCKLPAIGILRIIIMPIWGLIEKCLITGLVPVATGLTRGLQSDNAIALKTEIKPLTDNITKGA
jgi:hypothetical protein